METSRSKAFVLEVAAMHLGEVRFPPHHKVQLLYLLRVFMGKKNRLYIPVRSV